MHFSVIVPSYNVARYVDECVRSASLQRFDGAHEVIVVDDGSTDDTPAIVGRLASELPNVRAFFQTNDGAPGKARNRAIEQARGDYLVFLDSDDVLPQGALARLRAAAGGSPCVIAGARDVLDDGSRVVGRRSLPSALLGDDRLDGRLRLRNRALYVNASGKAFRRAVVATHGIRFTEGHPGQDTAFAVSFFAFAESTRCIEDVVYRLRIRGDATNPSLTQQFDPRAVERRLTSARQCLADLESRGIPRFAADARAYLLLGILSRVFQHRRRGRIEALDRMHAAIRDFWREGRALGAPRRMSGEFRRRWLVASALLSGPTVFRVGVSAFARLRGG